ncbi:MAG: tyrosine--tRNA ligase [Candidatus Moranbacteria bacterium]|nr:tyrosine--tRNA ligase [Candidatus Moranbacteria bacterium]
MPKILKDKKLIDTFLNRGVEAIYPSKKAFEKKLLSGERLKIYQGFDPTGKYLHIGHAMGIRALRILQQLGHEVIFLVGDFTSKVGDPDKDTTREMLTDKKIAENMKGWKEQASQLIDFYGKNPVKFLHNYDWLHKLKFEDILELMSKITLQRMIERDMFERRLKDGDPIRLHELVYPLMQGYDGVAMKVDLEIGGADQTFNMLIGRDLSKAYLGKEKFVRTHKMMDAPDARTMSKTKGNGINLSDSPQDMFGKAMSYPDELILTGFELLTEIPTDEIAQIKKAMHKGENPMIFKKQMAYEIVKLIKGEKAAKEARNYFEQVFSEGQNPDEAPKIKVSQAELLIDVLVNNNLAQSKSDAKRKMQQNGVKIEDKVKNDLGSKIEKDMDGKILRVGKREFRRLVVG